MVRYKQQGWEYVSLATMVSVASRFLQKGVGNSTPKQLKVVLLLDWLPTKHRRLTVAKWLIHPFPRAYSCKIIYVNATNPTGIWTRLANFTSWDSKHYTHCFRQSFLLSVCPVGTKFSKPSFQNSSSLFLIQSVPFSLKLPRCLHVICTEFSASFCSCTSLLSISSLWHRKFYDLFLFLSRSVLFI